jgi:1-phosphofructokinase
VITTVTANPSLDRTFFVPALTIGNLHRATRVMTEPSGKGVNVSMALKAAGIPTKAVLPIGGTTGHELSALREGAGLCHVDVAISDPIRSNVSIIADDGTTTKVNEPGPTLSLAEVAALLAAAEGEPGQWLAWCGSLPLGFDTSALVQGISRARARGARVALDTSDATLRAVLDQPPHHLPHLLKPNLEELATVSAHHIASPAAAAEAAAELVRRGVEAVLVSLGADGALLVRHDVVLHGVAPVRSVLNTAGAGDALLAGFLAAGDVEPTEQLAEALRFGAAAVQHEGTVLGRIDRTQRVEIRDMGSTYRPRSD